jgi:photosynthetic reaction center cytochrome c subunit
MKNQRLRVLVLFGLVMMVSTFQSSRSDPIHNVNGGAQPAIAGQITASFNQEQALERLRTQISDKQNQPAEQVFKNIQLLKGMPAGRLLRVMEVAYAKSLGVDCTHCHVAGQWEKEDKPTKQIARDMWAMMGAINAEYLKKIKNLKSASPGVNCTTCHRGQVQPALNLP